MDRGDVFRVAGEELMYIAEAVAPNGTIYARVFDLYQGAYGELGTIPPTVECEILFNAFKPENEEGWDYCEVVHTIDWPRQTEWFEANSSDPASQGRIAQSPAYRFIRGEPLFESPTGQAKGVHQQFVNKLLADGWEEVLERRNPWFHLRLKRKKGFQVQNEVQVQEKSKGWFHNPFKKFSK